MKQLINPTDEEVVGESFEDRWQLQEEEHKIYLCSLHSQSWGTELKWNWLMSHLPVTKLECADSSTKYLRFFA